MLFLPSVARALFMSFSVAYTHRTFERMLTLIVGAILTSGRRTITGILWTLRGRVPGHPSTYHRVFSRAVWSLWPLGHVLAAAILRHIPASLSTAKAVIMTPCVRPITMSCFAGDTAGWSWPSR